MQIKKIVLTLAFLYSTHSMSASYDNQIWVNFSAQGQFAESSSWGAYLELQPRYSSNQQKTYETIARPALIYKTNDFGNFLLGYLSRSNSESKELEKRIWTQWSKTYDFLDFKFLSRFRYESRDLNLDKRSERIRFMGRLLHDEVLFFNFKPLASIELFYNLNDAPPSIKSGMKQSRNSVGLSQKFDQGVTLDFLLTKNYVDSDTTEDLDNSVLQIQINKEF